MLDHKLRKKNKNQRTHGKMSMAQHKRNVSNVFTNYALESNMDENPKTTERQDNT